MQFGLPDAAIPLVCECNHSIKAHLHLGAVQISAFLTSASSILRMNETARGRFAALGNDLNHARLVDGHVHSLPCLTAYRLEPKKIILVPYPGPLLSLR